MHGEDLSASQGMLAPPTLTSRWRNIHVGQLVLRVAPPVIVFLLLLGLWEYGVTWLRIPAYTLPRPSEILQTIPTIDTLKSDAYYTTVREALPGFLLGSIIGFLTAVVAARFGSVARGLIPYAVISGSIPIIGMAPIAVALFGSDWQSKAFMVAVLTFFPMLINAYRGLTAVDPLSLQLMRSYAAGGLATFLKLRLPASLPYVFNALKINVTLAMIGAIVGEYFGGPSAGLGFFIHDKSGEFATAEVWSAVVVACAIGLAVYLLVSVLERLLTSWHISYRRGV
ncbi:MAG: ABC transporter permease [Chloroflexi bacterium]|nr:MAG: ABC transporter permease [Chloroflexota bacterium]